MSSKLIDNLVLTAIENQTFPGVEILLAKKEKIILHKSWGKIENRENSPALTKGSLFDIASLTKIVATAPAVMLLLEQGKIYLEQQASQIIPEFSKGVKKLITIKQLLTHTSGLPAWSPLYLPEMNKEEAWQKLLNIPLESQPGTSVKYSCLGFLLLGEIIRRVSSQSLTEYCQKKIFEPLKLERTSFKPDPNQTDIIPTEYCPIRGKLLKGAVHDENAHCFDQEGGNAGVFSTAKDLFSFSRAMLVGAKNHKKTILSSRTIKLMWQNHLSGNDTGRGLGWDYQTRLNGYASSGDYMQPGTVGHTGFTGTSLWIDPKEEIIIIILSNRVNISREGNLGKMKDFRPKIHNLLVNLIDKNQKWQIQ